MNSVQDNYVLSNGIKIPCVGFGTWKLPNTVQTEDIVKTALDCGYRHIDTAFMYQNEESVGRAIRHSGIDRKEIFVTSKLSNQNHGYESTLKEFEQSMNQLGLDYLDLYLIHWPIPLKNRNDWKEANQGTWRAFEELYRAGKIRSIGVSNFLTHHLEALLDTAAIAPMVDQLELHPQYVQRDAVNYCKDHRIIVEAWAPLIRGQFDHPVILSLAEKYQKSPAQILLRWSLQHGFLPLPKSSSKDRMLSNANFFDFTLSEEDIDALTVLEKLGPTGQHPDSVDF